MIETPAAITTLLTVGMELIFYVVTLCFVLYTLVLVYHWFSFGTNKGQSLFMLAVFLLGSAPLFLTMAIAL